MAWTRCARFFSLSLAISCTAACGLAPRQAGTSGKTAAVSNRPQDYDRFLTIIRLQQPPLLSSLKAVQGQTQVDPEQRRLLEAEQASALAALRQLSPAIELLYSYKLVVNGLAIIAPRALEAQLGRASGASYVENDVGFSRLTPVKQRAAAPAPTPADPVLLNTVARIGAGRVQRELHLTGKGVRIGVIDGGIDYTHAMFGGGGTVAAFQDNGPQHPTPKDFPTAKVSGGVNLVGSDYDSAAADFARHIPRPNANPMDEQGHGTHVAGTIAGRGNGLDTYDGVAPDAELYAIKVFGKSGSAGDAVILEALELAADPSASLQPSRHLDIVNLSLAEDFGTQHVLYNEAVGNLVRGGTVVVAAAGNSGAIPYIVGAPSTAPAALSVAASVDNHRPEPGAERSADDSIVFFSSRGPRSLDSLLKPELAAPGLDVLSADFGTGHLGTQMSGTSMAAPHVAGAMALLKQAHPELNAEELKALAMGHSVALNGSPHGKPEPLTAMGAGRIDTYAAATAELLALPAAVSLGELAFEQSLSRQVELTLRNLSAKPQTLALTSTADSGLSLSHAAALELAPHEAKTIAVTIALAAPAVADVAQELDGSISIRSGSSVVRVPVLAMTAPRTRILAQDLRVHASSAETAVGAPTEMALVNRGALPSSALLFNLLGTSAPATPPPVALVNECAVQSAGWRIVQQEQTTLLQIAVSLIQPLTSWQLCELSLQVDATGTGLPAQELLGTHMDALSGDPEQAGLMRSVLTDAGSMRQLRHAFELSAPGTPQPAYTTAILAQREFQAFAHSTIAVMSVELQRLQRLPSGELRLKLGVLGDASKAAADSYVGGGAWLTLSEQDQAYTELPASVPVAAGERKTVRFRKGRKDLPLIAYLPYNQPEQGSAELLDEPQTQILRPVYQP